MSAEKTLTFASMTPDHLPAAVSLSRAEHWPHRIEDWALTLALGKGVVAMEDGRVVATAIATPFGPDTAAINMIIVDATMRGRGLGRRMMDAVMSQVVGCEQRLTATSDGLPLYEKLGFVAGGEILQHQGHVISLGGPEPEWTTEVDAVINLDRAAFGADRSILIRELFRQGRVCVSGNAFAAVRDFGRGKLVGPVVAATRDEAAALIRSVLSTIPGEFVRVDVPADSGLDILLTSWGLAGVGGGIAMRRNAKPRPEATVRTFALASQAMG